MGVRFRPGRWSAVLAVPGERIVDAIVPLEDLWGARARRLLERLANTSFIEECARAVESALPHEIAAGPVERAIAFLERAGGSAGVDDLARAAGLSARQFRRICLEKTGFTPKFLARILRFRHAAASLDSATSAVDLALDSGYYDQAHLIRDFREFAGRTPGMFRVVTLLLPLRLDEIQLRLLRDARLETPPAPRFVHIRRPDHDQIVRPAQPLRMLRRIAAAHANRQRLRDRLGMRQQIRNRRETAVPGSRCRAPR